jgi:hypothetical protein
MEPLVDAYVEAHPYATGTPQDDVAAFCAFLGDHPPGPPPAGWDDVRRLVEHLTWLGRWDAAEAALGPFARRSIKLDDGRDAWLHAAPLRSRWIRVAEFRALPRSMPWRDPSGTVILAFHKQPNMRGHFFQINRWTRQLLDRCDGTMTADALIVKLSIDSGCPADEIAPKLRKALRWWYTRGLVTFVAQV